MQTESFVYNNRITVHKKNISSATDYIKERHTLPSSIVMPDVRSFLKMYEDGYIDKEEIESLLTDVNALFMLMCVTSLEKCAEMNVDNETTMEIYNMRNKFRKSRAHIFSRNETKRKKACDEYIRLFEEMAIISIKLSSNLYVKKAI